MATDREHLRRTAPLIAAIALAVYLPAAWNGFVNWDDDVFVLQNEALRSPAGLKRIWTTLEMPEGFPNYPLFFTSFWLDYRLWGLNPVGYHAVNNLLHAANAVLVLLVARALGAGMFAAVFAGCLFAVHPLHVESVAWVSERKNLLSTLFSLCTVLAFLAHLRSGRTAWHAAALLAFSVALLGKTAVLTLPLSLLALGALLGRRERRLALAHALPMLALGAAAGLATVRVEPQTIELPFADRPLVAATAVLFYLQKVLLPWPLFPIYPRWEVSLGALWMFPPLLALLAALAWRRPFGWRWRWGLAHFGCLLLPVVGLVPFGFLEFSFVADHHAYFATAGLFIAFGEALARWQERSGSRVPPYLATAAIVVASTLTLQQVPVWRDSVSLWRHAIAGNDQAYVAFGNLGLALAESGDLAGARRELERAVALKPNYAHAYNNLGMVAYREKDFATAERHSRRSVELAPGSAAYRKNLAAALIAQGKHEQAAESLRVATRLAPADARLLKQAGELLVQAGDLPTAAAAYQQAARLQPGAPGVHNELGRVLLALSRHEEAVHAFEKALRLHPNRAAAHYNLALALLRAGRTEEAKEHLATALRLRPDFRPAREELERLRGAHETGG